MFAERNSLRSHLWLLFGAFLGLVVASVTITFLALETQRQDALAVNLAGRQRMLSQQMTWLALTRRDDAALAQARARFAQTLRALQWGGEVVDAEGRTVALPAAADPLLRRQLAAVDEVWQRFDRLLTQPRAASPVAGDAAPDSATAALTGAALELVAALDVAVSRLAELAQAKVYRLQLIQGTFLVLALLLLAAAYRVTQRRLVIPLVALDQAARDMAAGDLTAPIPRLAVAEFSRLAHALERMRVEVLASHRQLEARVQQRTRELNTAFEFSQEIAAQLELSRLLDSVTDRACALMGGRAAALCLLDERAGVLRLAAGSGEGQTDLTLRQSVDADLPRQVIGAGRTVVAETACAGCGFLRRLPGNQCVATPLRAGGATLGALCVVRPQEIDFDDQEQAAFTLLANAAAVAIVNARLVEAGRQQAQESAVQAERARLAADLHDNLAQTLSFLNLKVDRLHELIAAGEAEAAAEELAQMRGATTRAYAQVRAALTGLRLPEGKDEGFADRLAACIDEVMDATGLAVALEMRVASLPVLSAVVQQQVLHIVREALVNAWRHAQAGRVEVIVAQEDDQLLFTVRDDGCGFDPGAVDESEHLGLAIMRARAERSGGELSIRAQPGAGTQICVRYPLPARREAPAQEAA